MKLFKISIDFNYATADIFKSFGEENSISLSSETVDLLKRFQYVWNTEESTITPNISIIMGKLFCIDEKSINYLSSYLNSTRLLEIKIGNDLFYLLANIPEMKDSLNLKSSKIKYFSTGDIMEVTSPVFKEQNYPHLFRIDEIPSTFFCSEDFMNIVIANNLTGIIFEECKVKSKSWFSL